MASRWRFAALLGLAAVLTFTAVSEAHTLKMSRVTKANKTFAKLLCNAIKSEDGSCVASKPGRCHRISEHRARCAFFLTLDLEDGSRDRCLSLIDWYIRGKNLGLHPNYLGIRSCAELKPPTPEEPTS